MSTFNELRQILGVPLPFKEMFDTVVYSFPQWEIMIATHDTHELEVFLQSFGWSLQDFVKEYSRISTKA